VRGELAAIVSNGTVWTGGETRFPAVVYFYRLEAGGPRLNRKMIMIR
jgi:hypothetical protein